MMLSTPTTADRIKSSPLELGKATMICEKYRLRQKVSQSKVSGHDSKAIEVHIYAVFLPISNLQ